MNFLKYSLIFLLTLVMIGSAGYLLAARGMQSKPGYAKLTTPGWLSANTVVALNLGPGGLKPARWLINRIVKSSDNTLELPEQLLLTMLQDLQGLQLRVYEVNDNRPLFEQAIDESVSNLKQEDWQTIIKVREDDKRVVVMQSGNDKVISGLSLLATTPENAVFINLVGPLKPESVVEIANNF